MNLFRDDNREVGAGYGRPVFDATTGIKSATTGAAIAELNIAGINIRANQTAAGELLLRLSTTGANPCYFSLGAAATPPADNTHMILLQANSTHLFRALAADVSLYHQQVTGAITLQVAVVK